MANNSSETNKPLDPAVSSLLAGMEQHQAELQLPRRDRERIIKSRLKIQARREQRVTYDLPPVLREDLRDLAEHLGIPASQLAALALARFLNEYRDGRIDLEDYKQPSRSPRYDWNLVFPENLLPRGKKKKGGS
jgi:hypothetical protein